MRFFEKWPNWLRWVLLGPSIALAAFVGMMVAWVGILLTNLSTNMQAGFTFGPHILEFFRMYIVAGFIVGDVFFLSPSYKNISCIIISALITALGGAILAINMYTASSPWAILTVSVAGLLAGAWVPTVYILKEQEWD